VKDTHTQWRRNPTLR